MSVKQPQIRKINTLCGICPSGCNVTVIVKEGRIERILPASDTTTPSSICVRGAASKEIVYSPQRLLKPLKRVGRKGEEAFEPIGWDEALSIIAKRLLEIRERYGAAAVAIYAGRGGYFEDGVKDVFAVECSGEVSSNLLYPFGSPNTASCSSVCYISHGYIAPMTTLGLHLEQLKPDLSNTSLLVIWGANPLASTPPSTYQKILAAKKKGVKIVAIDPRRSGAASIADYWIPLRPGTDGALALSILNTLISEDLIDAEFAEKWCRGYSELKEYVKRFEPEDVEKITWVPASKIEGLAKLIGREKPSTLILSTGVEYSNCGVQTARAIYTIYALTGNFDVKGGLVAKMPPRLKRNRIILKPPSQVKPVGAERYPVFYKYSRCMQAMELPKAVLKGEPYPVKALIVHGASMLTSLPGTELWRRVFEELEFMVVIDRFLTSDCLYADYILPASTYYEIESYKRGENRIQLRRRVIEPLGESRSDYSICYSLAERLGYNHLYPREEELIDFALKDTGVDKASLESEPLGVVVEGIPMKYKKYELGLLRRDGKQGFETPSGRFEIASTVLEENGYDPLPVYIEPKEGPISTPHIYKDYPLVFTCGARLPHLFRSQHLNIPSLLRLQPKPQVIMHVEDASSRGIEDGDEVYVATPRGRIKLWAKVTDGILKGVVEVNSGGGGLDQPEAWRKANVNLLTDPDNRDPISGFPVYKALLCQVEKA
ncbi:MAG: molybdopterin-dependent oxidoreductase [Nitrososphaerales archaeon]